MIKGKSFKVIYANSSGMNSVIQSTQKLLMLRLWFPNIGKEFTSLDFENQQFLSFLNCPNLDPKVKKILENGR